MLSQDMQGIIGRAKKYGWVLEPEAKRLLSLAGIAVPDFRWVTTLPEALEAADRIGYPVVAKVVSPAIVHKSESNGVAVGIKDAEGLTDAFNRFSRLKGFAGVLIETLVFGFELIIGAKIDYQFGPVILLGIGGTGVEIYQDVVFRMAPLSHGDVPAMVENLTGAKLLKGYRGAEPVDMAALMRLMNNFSALVMDLGDVIDSIDLNPVKCTSTTCAVADARVMLAREGA
ncbi:MAG: acetate--CoA ligase family protein [Desulfobacterales bacterium]|jgi:acetate---CoA ligase (ADP-forming) subunit beta